jgi:hypothetical protein
VSFGGVLAGAIAGGTWEWDGATWTSVAASGSPPHASVYSGSIAFDAASQRILLVVNAWNGLAVWAYDGASWVQWNVAGTASGPGPLGLGAPAVIADATGRLLVADAWAGIHELLHTPARAASYGQSCGAVAPTLLAAGFPRVGAATFALDLTGTPPLAPVAVAGADAAAALPMSGCTFLLARNQATLYATADANGFAAIPLPIPGDPALVGQSFFFQGAALAPSSANGFVLSAGLRLDLGR